MLQTLTVFSVGFILGAASFYGIGSFLLNQAEKRLKEKNTNKDPRKDMKTQREKYAQVKPRLDRAAEITQQIAEIAAQAEQPSKNSLHSRFKNGLIAEARKLEDEKTEILRSIIADGFDPEITVSTTEGLRQMHLSEYLTQQGYDVTPPPPAGATTDNAAPPKAGEAPKEEPAVRKVGNFFVIKGGKNETNN